jgi:hypothetical protein
MLHEVLLVLAGYESELISENAGTVLSAAGSQLHPSEHTQLLQVARFGQLNDEVTKRVKFVQSSYMKSGVVDKYDFSEKVFPGPYSSCCHALCGVLDRSLLQSFRETLIGIEQQILDRDSLYVGGDNVVSLSFVTSKTIKEYERRFLYAKSLLYFIMADGNERSTPGSHEIINRLMNDNVTGYKDIQELTTQLLIQVESSWLRSLRSWIIYGRLPVSDKEDLLVQLDKKTGEFYVKDIPECITDAIANDILIVGSCLNRMDIFGSRGSSENKAVTSHNYERIVESNIELLSSVELPISIGQFGAIIKKIRVAVYKDIVTTILPTRDMLRFFEFLRKVALCGSSDFIRLLCDLSENKPGRAITNREHSSQVFNNALTTSLEDANAADWEVEVAGRIFKYFPVTLSRQKSTEDRFDDFLFRIRCELHIDLYWPNNILVSKSDTVYYNVIFSLVSAVYRARCKIETLWRSKISDKVDSSKKLAHKVKIFLDILYDYIQNSVIDRQFDVLKKIIDSQGAKNEIDPDVIISSHRQYLENIVQNLCLNDRELRIQLRKFLLASITLNETISDQIENLEQEILHSMDRILQKFEENQRIGPEMNLLLLKFEMVRQ